MVCDEVSIRLDKPANVCLACGCVLKDRGNVAESSRCRAGPGLGQTRTGGAVQSNDGGRQVMICSRATLSGMQEGCKSSGLKSRKEARCIGSMRQGRGLARGV